MIGITLLIAVIGLALICVGAYFYSQKCIELFLNKDTEDLGYILDTEGVPARWCKKYVGITTRMKNRGAPEARIERVRAFANKRYVKRMNRIIAFAKGAPVFVNEGERSVTVDELKTIQEQWRRREYLHEPY